MNSPFSTPTEKAVRSLLSERHKKTCEWLAAVMRWRRELTSLQRILDFCLSRHFDFQSEMNDYQNVLLYYREELLDSILSRLHLHKDRILQLLAGPCRESPSTYFTEHEQILNEADALGQQIRGYCGEIYDLIRRATGGKSTL